MKQLPFTTNLLSGLKWTFSQQVVIAIQGLVKMLILVRILPTEVFGLFALTNLVIGFIAIFSDLGIATALFHKDDISKVEYSSLYWINLFVNCSLFILLFICAPAIGSYFEEESLGLIIRILSVNLVIVALGKHFAIYAEKELLFSTISKVTVGCAILNTVASIGLAYNDYGIYSLVYPLLLSTLISSLSYFLILRKKYPLQFIVNFASVKNFFKIGIFQTGSTILNYCSNHIDTIIISKVLGVEILGVYDIVRQLLSKFYFLINNTINKVSIPIFTKFNNDEEKLKSRYLELARIFSFLNSIFYGMIIYFSKEIMAIYFGAEFIQYQFILVWFSLIFLFRSIINLAGILIVSKGRTERGFFWVVFKLILVTPLILVLGKKFGINGILFSLFFFSFQGIISYYFIVLRKVQSNIAFLEYLFNIAREIPKGLIILVIAYFIFWSLNLQVSLIPLIFIKLLIYSVVSCLYLYIFHLKFIRNSVVKILNKSQKQ